MDEVEVFTQRVTREASRRGIAVVLAGPEMARRLERARQFPDRWIPGGENTWEEARRVLHTGMPEFTIVTSAYHQPRAFLTFLRAAQLHQRDREVLMWNDCAIGLPIRPCNEAQKIDAYQRRGHVASYEEGLAYLDWRDARGAA